MLVAIYRYINDVITSEVVNRVRLCKKGLQDHHVKDFR